MGCDTSQKDRHGIINGGLKVAIYGFFFLADFLADVGIDVVLDMVSEAMEGDVGIDVVSDGVNNACERDVVSFAGAYMVLDTILTQLWYSTG